MDCNNSEQNVELDNGSMVLSASEKVCESSEVTKNGIVQENTQNEPKKDSNVIIVEASNYSSCDNNSSNISQINNSKECFNCDTEVIVEVEEKQMAVTDIKDNNTIKDTEIASNIDTTSNTNNFISPETKKMDSISVQEVTKKVDKMNIVENSNTQNSSVIIKNESSSLRNLLLYHTDSSDEENEDFDAAWQHNVFPSSSSSSESEMESHECVEISDDDDEENVEFVLPNNKNQLKKESKPEDNVDFLPPLDISNLQIDYEKEEFIHIGHISNFINATVTVETVENVASYNIETVLFIDDKTSKKPLGGITDVIGPVSRPVYCIQLRDAKEVEKLGLKQGMKVYSAPKSSCTKYVFLKDLLKMKGTDASWIGDQEQPSDEDDSSDEEFEREYNPRKRAHHGSLERHKQFERAKNKSNIMKTQVADLMDRYRNVTSVQNIHMFPHGFDPKVPPPNARPPTLPPSVRPPSVPQNANHDGYHSSPSGQPRIPSNPWSTPPSQPIQRAFPRTPLARPPYDYYTNAVLYRQGSPGPSHPKYY